MVRALFVCSRNRLRSTTAEEVFRHWQNVETASAGTDADAEVALEPDLLEWADVVFVMERPHRNRLANRFGRLLRDKDVVVLNVPDDYEYMDAALIEVLEKKVAPHLIRRGGRPASS